MKNDPIKISIFYSVSIAKVFLPRIYAYSFHSNEMEKRKCENSIANMERFSFASFDFLFRHFSGVMKVIRKKISYFN